eukprot:scaffold49792_cov63-Cyclotella_meneghiniana.AAC.3
MARSEKSGKCRHADKPIKSTGLWYSSSLSRQSQSTGGQAPHYFSPATAVAGRRDNVKFRRQSQAGRQSSAP